MLIFSVYNRLPATFRYKLKQVFRTAGHSASWLDGLIAARDARGKKSLQRSLQHTLRLLELADIATLDGLRTVDFGAGYVPTDTVAHWLLGARQASALDYNAIADFTALRVAIERDDAAALLKLVPPALQTVFGQRLACLRSLPDFTPAALEQLGIHYLAPYDMLSRQPQQSFDLILSTSVLEHIARRDIPAMLRALAAALAPGGRMIHEIHLEDHLDIQLDPWNFFRTGTRYDPATDHDARGNRVLREEWAAYFADLAQCQSTEAEVRFSAATSMPPRTALLPQYAELARQQLFASHLVYVSHKLQ